MAVEQMKLVNIVGPLGLFDEVVQKCVTDSGFAPENVLHLVGSGGGLIPFQLKNPSSALLSRAVNLCEKLGVQPRYHDFTVEQCDEEMISAYFDELTMRYEDCMRRKESSRRLIDDDRQMLSQIEKVSGLDENLDELYGMNFTKLRFGRIPRDIYENYAKYVEEDQNIVFQVTGRTREYVYGMYLTPRPATGKSDALFSSLHFERIHLSDRIHGSPKEAAQQILTEIEQAEKELEKNKQELLQLRKSEEDHLLTCYAALKYSTDTYDMRKYSAHTNDTFYLCGWVPQSSLEAFNRRFDEYADRVYVLEEPADTPEVHPPTKLKNRWPFRVFEQFVEMYGLPAYNEADPTTLLAISYSLFFGVMFGDVGQGVVLVLLGLLADKKMHMKLGKVIATVGCSSILFGFIYGSVFGSEKLLPGFKLFESTQNTNTILLAAVGMGLLFISVAMIYNIYNGIRQHDLGKALFSQNGVAGFIFYWAVILGVLFTMLTDKKLMKPAYILFLIVGPLILILLQEPLGRLLAKRKDWMPEEKGQYLTESFFELFEILLSFLANTISFVRIGAFALNHVGMMLVVYSLMDSVGAASPVVFVLGNIFVIGLEGLIVGIQVLRLEFYELFGRFYSGSGAPYRPFTVKFGEDR